MNGTDRIFYVYLIFDTNCVPRYIGKGRGDRAKVHASRGSHNPQLHSMIRRARDAGMEMPVVILAENLMEQEAFAFEVAWIAAIGRVDKGAGSLVNHTDGGDGVCGHRRTPEQKLAMSIARKGKLVSAAAGQAISLALKGRLKTPEHCAAVSAAKKGISHGPLSESHRAAIGRAHLGRKLPEAQIEAMRQRHANMSEEAMKLKSERITLALTGKKLSDEHRESISRVQGNLSPESKAARSKKLSDALRGRKLTPEQISRRRKQIDAPEVCRRYREGESAGALSLAFSVSVCAINRRLAEGGVQKRSLAEARRKPAA